MRSLSALCGSAVADAHVWVKIDISLKPFCGAISGLFDGLDDLVVEPLISDDEIAALPRFCVCIVVRADGLSANWMVPPAPLRVYLLHRQNKEGTGSEPNNPKKLYP
jgi:hypothetical protein